MGNDEWGMVVWEWEMVNAKCVRLPPSKIAGEWGMRMEYPLMLIFGPASGAWFSATTCRMIIILFAACNPTYPPVSPQFL